MADPNTLPKQDGNVERDQYGFKIERSPSATPLSGHKKSSSSVSLMGKLKSAVTVTLTKDKWEFYRNLDPAVTQLPRDTTLMAMIRYTGVPADLRKTLWPVFTSAKQRQSRNKIAYRDIIETQGKKDSPVQAQIEVDLKRSLPTNKLFESDEGIAKLRNILVAFSWVNPRVGYCQSMNFWSAFLLLFVDEEMVFWMTRSIVEDMLPDCYYAGDMLDVIIDGHVTNALLENYLPKTHAHLQVLGVDVPTIVSQWYLCLFVTLLPIPTALRFFDSFCFEGHKMLFRAALSTFKMFETQILAINNFEEAFVFVSKLPQRVENVDAFIDAAFDKLWLLRFNRAKIQQLRTQFNDNLKRSFAEKKKKIDAARNRSASRTPEATKIEISLLEKVAAENAEQKAKPKGSEPPPVPAGGTSPPPNAKTAPKNTAYRPKSWRAEQFCSPVLDESYFG